jgi:hypothetical protein
MGEEYVLPLSREGNPAWGTCRAVSGDVEPGTKKALHDLTLRSAAQGVGAGGEMNQALYAHMNNKRKMKKKKVQLTGTGQRCGQRLVKGYTISMRRKFKSSAVQRDGCN